MPTAFWLSPKVFDFVSVHLQVSDDHLRATTVEWFASSSPWNTNLPHPCHDKAEESSPILVVGWLMQLSRLASAVTCSHRRSKYNESRNLEDLSIEKLPCTRYPNALARVVESHEQQGPMCPMSENLTSSWHNTSIKSSPTQRWPIPYDEPGNYWMQCVKCIVDCHISILCTGTRQKVSVLEEFLSNVSRPGGAFLDWETI